MMSVTDVQAQHVFRFKGSEKAASLILYAGAYSISAHQLHVCGSLVPEWVRRCPLRASRRRQA